MPPTPLDTVKLMYAAFARRDTATIFRLLTPEIELLQSEELPWGGRYYGHAEAQQFLAKLTGTITSTVTIERYLSAGDQVVAVGWTEGTVNATGAPYRVPVVHLWTVYAGAVHRVHFLIDNPTMLAALAEKSPAATTTR